MKLIFNYLVCKIQVPQFHQFWWNNMTPRNYWIRPSFPLSFYLFLHSYSPLWGPNLINNLHWRWHKGRWEGAWPTATNPNHDWRVPFWDQQEWKAMETPNHEWQHIVSSLMVFRLSQASSILASPFRQPPALSIWFDFQYRFLLHVLRSQQSPSITNMINGGCQIW